MVVVTAVRKVDFVMCFSAEISRAHSVYPNVQRRKTGWFLSDVSDMTCKETGG
jgi:hypothetical protein